MDKCKDGTYHKGYFLGGINVDLNIIACEDKIVISSIIQSYVLYWYHTYILCPDMDRTEAIIFQHLYWTSKIEALQKEVTNCDTFQYTK